jgi:hypothetical protein
MPIHKSLFALLLAVVLCSTAGASLSPEDKLKPEELVTKHLASIGSPDVLANAKSVVAIGDAKAISRSAAVKDVVGVSQIASAGDKVLLAMVFNSTSYPFEKVAFNGDKMTIALWTTSGQRSDLGDFLMSQQTIFKEGLIGGVLSSAWPLRNMADRGAKLSYAGTKKIENRLLHELKYTPRKGGGDLKISLFFDAETFRHVRSEYSYQVSARMGARPSSGPMASPGSLGGVNATDAGSQTLNRYKLIEEFSDFQTVNNLTLPRTYHLRLTIDTQRSKLLEWVMNFKQFALNEPIEATAFNLATTN